MIPIIIRNGVLFDKVHRVVGLHSSARGMASGCGVKAGNKPMASHTRPLGQHSHGMSPSMLSSGGSFKGYGEGSISGRSFLATGGKLKKKSKYISF
jgi:hypothetical protein